MVRRYESGREDHEFDIRLSNFFLCVRVSMFILVLGNFFIWYEISLFVWV